MLLVVALVIFAVVGWVRTRSAKRVALALLVPGLGTLVLLASNVVQGRSAEGALRASALLMTLVLLATAGEPDLIMDAPSVKAKARRRLPKEERLALAVRERRTAVAQLTLLIAIVTVALLVGLTSLGDWFD